MKYQSKARNSNASVSKPNGYTLPNANRYRRRNSQPPNEQLSDYGPYPFATNIEDVTERNTYFRKALWTGEHLQLTLMSLQPGEDIGLERHSNTDQFIRIEEGRGMVMMGDDPNTPNFQQVVSADSAFIIPAGKWHNLTNIGNGPLKLYSIYAPAQHPYGTIHETKVAAQAAENH